MADFIGTSGNDSLTGGEGADLLDGAAGNDMLRGGGGADRLLGGTGNDRFEGLTEGDTVDGGDGWDELFLPRSPGQENYATPVLFNLALGTVAILPAGGNAGWQAVVRDVEQLHGGKGWSVTGVGDDGDNFLSGNVVVGGGGNDVLVGGLVDYSGVAVALDVVTEAFSVTFPGSAGTVSGNVRVHVGTGGEVDSIAGSQLLLGVGNDRAVLPLTGNASTGWRLFGGPGDDQLVADTVVGGPGDDTLGGGIASYADDIGAVQASLNSGIALTPDGTDTLAVLDVEGGRTHDRLEGNAAANRLYGHAGKDSLLGGAGNDELYGGDGGDWLQGDAGNDRLGASEGADTLLGGDGNDVLFETLMLNAPFEVGSIDGGGGLDMLRFSEVVRDVTVDLAAGELRLGTEDGSLQTVLRGIEAVQSSDQADRLRGADGATSVAHEWFVPRAGRDTVDGGGGIDCVAFAGARSEHQVVLSNAATLAMAVQRVGQAAELDTLTNVERLRFSDMVLAFGDRAVELAQLAFALWGPAIAGSRGLFGYGIDWYDRGRSFTELSSFALSFFASENDAALAARLATNIPGAGSAAQLSNQITTQGGGVAGRLAVTEAVAQGQAARTLVQAAGLASNGIECSTLLDGWPMFVAGQAELLDLFPLGSGA